MNRSRFGIQGELVVVGLRSLHGQVATDIGAIPAWAADGDGKVGTDCQALMWVHAAIAELQWLATVATMANYL